MLDDDVRPSPRWSQTAQRAAKGFLQHQTHQLLFPTPTYLLSSCFWPSAGSTGGGQGCPRVTEGQVAEGISLPGTYTENLPAKEKVAWAEGRGKALPFRALLMTRGETTQQSFRRSDGRSRRQMFPTYVEN